MRYAARHVLSLALVVSSAIVVIGPVRDAGAQTSVSNSCADCHFANPDAPARDHLYEWDRSPHGRNSVGCQACHGGNSTTFESFQAHQGVLNSSNPASPVHRSNLPRTCGTCHTGPFVEFQSSQHFALLGQGDRRVPVCVTCHGSVAANLLSARGLERECASCHGPDRIAPRPGRAEDARTLLEGVDEVRESLKAADRLISRIGDAARRQQLEDAYQQAEVPLIQARQAGHRFVFDGLQERLSVARQRVAALLQQLVNPQ